MVVKYLSQEWLELMQEGLEEEFSTKGTVSTSFAEVVLNTPQGATVWCLLELAKGKFVSYTMGTGECPPCELSSTGNYDVFRKVFVGEAEGADCISAGEFVIGGDVPKAMSLLGTYNRMEEVKLSIETEF